MQCPEAHLFCTTCMMSYAETKLGEHDATIVCMDQSGCKLPFPDSELRRFLSPKLLELYERVKQRKEIEAAGLEGLEECPFCEYKVVIENDNERLFRCENDACGAVTCRQCKKLVSVRCQTLSLAARCCCLLPIVSFRLGPCDVSRATFPMQRLFAAAPGLNLSMEGRIANNHILLAPTDIRIIFRRVVKVRSRLPVHVGATTRSLTHSDPPTSIGRAEVDDDKKLGVRHAIEEAMSASSANRWFCSCG